ncbi:ParA family protein [Magnetofaba australis]|uniref:Putative cobyrinic acid a,c-diamide synthase n=1 Tax=Magnetofaba australis IT-1 TaxID=1434232 RepID=A0A1Y2K845_9PROT|nr:ParA family protein [Magnetofaba australis]OSM06921.1 putative cobyrinic acid a,c-diamide synthase [Magnetofaba australis IT-1]
MITVIGNLKGGCGKSTIAFNLAVWLARAKRRVAAFDLDPQATLSDVVEVRREEGAEPDITVYRPDRDPGKVFKEHADDDILVDVGASNLWAMRQAIAQAQRIVVPVPPSQADVWSTQRFLNIINETTLQRETPPEVMLFVNRADTHPALKESEETEEALKMLPGVRVIEARIGQRTAYRRSFSEGLGVFEMAPASKAAKEFVQLASLLYPETAPKKRAAPKRQSAKAGGKSAQAVAKGGPSGQAKTSKKKNHNKILV